MADVALSYNALDQVTQVTDGVGVCQFSYDAQGRLMAQSGPFAGDTQTYSYDALQRVQAQSVERGASGGVQTQSYAYDALGRLASLNSNGTQGVGNFAYHYVGLTGMLSRLDMPNGTHTDQSYDSLQRLTSVANSTNAGQNLDRYAYAYSNRDIRTGVQMQHGSEAVRQVAYAYDGIDQLTGEHVTGGAANTAFTKTYAYDAMGNRTQTDYADASQSVRTVSATNPLNQLTGSNTASNVAPTTGAAHSYDAAGNLTQTLGSDGSKTLYTYDDADRLTRLERRDASGVPQSASEWVYDYASRKPISREFTFADGAWQQTSEKRRVFDGMDVVQERNAANEVTAQVVRSGNIEGILSRSTAAGASFYGYDGGGNVTLLTDSNGAEVGHYRYDAFGNTLESSGTRATENPYRFSTKELSSSGLYDFGYRFYLPASGTWLNRDPLREEGGVNLYSMVDNNSVNNADEYGLITKKQQADAIKEAKKAGYKLRQGKNGHVIGTKAGEEGVTIPNTHRPDKDRGVLAKELKKIRETQAKVDKEKAEAEAEAANGNQFRMSREDAMIVGVGVVVIIGLIVAPEITIPAVAGGVAMAR